MSEFDELLQRITHIRATGKNQCNPSCGIQSVELSEEEQLIASRIRRAKLFIFLRQVRHQLFDQQFQTELGKLYSDSPKGYPPVPPAQLALVTILQAYTGASDDEAIFLIADG